MEPQNKYQEEWHNANQIKIQTYSDQRLSMFYLIKNNIQIYIDHKGSIPLHVKNLAKISTSLITNQTLGYSCTEFISNLIFINGRKLGKSFSCNIKLIIIIKYQIQQKQILNNIDDLLLLDFLKANFHYSLYFSLI
ncbi:unnamed protein product [Paramecium sonneborni]|uniref:Uncharacterized protein n=1 Tax=Paramecium sonneborni TaxID=65129 RepID=A0A8S1RS90_9CILI|nr:unnamed protein product [Paramecium sonneborni]